MEPQESGRSPVDWYTSDPWKAYLGWLSPRWAEPREDFDPEEWCDALVEGGFQTAVVHAKHHDGICFFPSRFRSAQPPRDFFGEIVGAAKKRGIRIVAYYSTTFDTWTWEEHPEWSCREQDGSVTVLTRFPFPIGVCCHVNPGYRQFLLGQLEEIQGAYDTDGFWMDGFDYTGYPSGACFCHFCRERFAKDNSGMSLEAAYLSDRLRLWQRDVFLELMKDIVTIANRGRADRVVVYNNAGTNLELGYERIDELCSLNSMEAHSALGKSVTARLLAGQRKSFEIYTPVADKVFSWTPRTTPLLKLETAIVAAHGGATLAGLDVTASGRIPGFQTRQMAEVGAFVRRVAGVCHEAEPVYDVGVLIPKDQWKDERGTWAVCLLKHHHAFCQVPLHVRDFSIFRVVVVADGYEMTPDLAAALEEYVSQGGNVVVECSGAGGCTEYGDMFLLSKLLGVSANGRHGFDVSYIGGIAGELADGLWDGPIRAGADGFRVVPVTARVLARYVYPVARYSSQRWIWREPNPPRAEISDDAAVTVNHFGKGKAVFVACPAGLDEAAQRRGVMKLCSNIVSYLCPEELWRTNAPSGVEIVLSKKEGKYFLHVLNHYVEQSSRFDTGDDSIPSLAGFDILVNTKRIGSLGKVTCASTGASVPATRINDYMRIHVDILAIQEMYLLEP